MYDPFKTIVFHDKEFLWKNWHYPPGWYFYDEENDAYGPFENRPHCERGAKLYLMQLMAGVAPTQIGKANLIGKTEH